MKNKLLDAVLIPGAVLLLVLLTGRFGSPGPYTVPQTPPEQVRGAYDLVVVGSDPEGIAAAVSGARNGLSVLLADTRPELGGLFTRGWLNSLDMNYGPDGEILNKGIFLEFYSRVKGDSFDVEQARRVFNGLVAEPNLDVVLDAVEIVPRTVSGNNGTDVIRGVGITTPEARLNVTAGAVIDATQDGDMAALAGVPFSVGRGDIGGEPESMAVTRVFKLTGVGFLDWLKIMYHLRYKEGKGSGANMRSAWGFSALTSRYEPSGDRVMLRGLNMGRQNDGSLLVNALLILGVDPLGEEGTHSGVENHLPRGKGGRPSVTENPRLEHAPGEIPPAGGISRREAMEIAAAEMPLVVEFLRRHVPGLDHAELGGMAPELYVRESRHIYAEYRLTLDDVLENRDFADRVAFGSYPVDIQASGPDTPGVIIGRPVRYAVPFRCLVPLGVDGLLVVGRAAGFDSLAHGSARTVPVGMAAGQAAGAAAGLALRDGLTFRALAADQYLMNELQSMLNEQGMDLQPVFPVDNQLADHWAYEGLKFIRGLGLATGGYDNDYRLDEPIAHQRFLNVLSRVVKQCGVLAGEQPVFYAEDNTFNVYDASYAMAGYLGLELNKEDSFAYLADKGFFAGGHWEEYFGHETPLTHGAAYMMIGDFVGFVESCEDKMDFY